MGLGFFIHTFVVRYLGPTKYGVYGYAVSLFAIFQPFINYGAEDVYLKDIISKKDKKVILGSGLSYKLLSAVLSYIVMSLSLVVLGLNDWEIISLILVLGLYNFFNTLSIFEIYLQSKMDFKSISLARLSGYIFSSIVKILIVLLELPLIFLAISFVLEIVLARLLVFYKVRSLVKDLKVSKAYMVGFFKKTWPFLLTVIIISLSQKSGVFFLERSAGLEIVGIYTVMLTLTRFIDFLPVAVLTTIIPKIIETKQRDYGQYTYRLSAIYFIMVILVLSMFSFFLFFSEFIVRLFYGDEFKQLADVLPWGVLTTLVTYINLSKAKHFLLEEMNKEWLIYNAGSLVVTLSLQFWLVPQYEIYGALASYAGGYLVFGVMYSCVSKSYRNILKIVFRSPLFPIKFILKRL